MIIRGLCILNILGALLVSVMIVPLAKPEVVDKIAVVVNNEVITEREIASMLRPVYEQYRSIYYGDELITKLEEARKNLVNQMIEDRLVISEAKKMNVQVDDKEVDERIEDVKRQIGSNETFEKALVEQGVSIRELKTRYREQIMRRKLIDHKIGSKIVVTPAEVSDYYDKHMNEFVQPEEVSLRNILIRPKEGEPVEKTVALGKEILRRVKEGGDFGGLAKEYSEGPYASEGGLMGYVKKGDLLPELEIVVFQLKAGEVSDLIQSSVGYHIFLVEEKRERRVKPLSEVRSDIEEMIFRLKAKDKIKEWVEGLRKNAYIEFK